MQLHLIAITTNEDPEKKIKATFCTYDPVDIEWLKETRLLSLDGLPNTNRYIFVENFTVTQTAPDTFRELGSTGTVRSSILKTEIMCEGWEVSSKVDAIVKGYYSKKG